MRLSYYSSLTLQMTGAIHLQANDIDLETRQQHHAFVYSHYRSRKRSWHQIRWIFSCCCLPLLPQFVNIILATWGSLFWGPLYSLILHPSILHNAALRLCFDASVRLAPTCSTFTPAALRGSRASDLLLGQHVVCEFVAMQLNSPFTKMMSVIWHWLQKGIG